MPASAAPVPGTKAGLHRLLTRLRNTFGHLVPMGYEDETGFHYGARSSGAAVQVGDYATTRTGTLGESSTPSA